MRYIFVNLYNMKRNELMGGNPSIRLDQMESGKKNYGGMNN